MKDVTRRGFLAATAAGAAMAANEKPAILGGPKIRTRGWPGWPVIDKTEDDALLATLRGKRWYRGSGRQVDAFEKAYAEATGAKTCLATANGTSSLIVSLAALGVGAGDEVIVPPYTFIATINAVLLFHALPVFVDSDRETFQIDPKKIEAAITPRTAAIMPVHIGGSAADLDAILAVAEKRNLPVIEDACQAHLGEWRGKKLGTLGAAGCFSFQASKNLNSGEGGAILSNSPELIEKCYAFHNNSRGRKAAGYGFSYASRGVNLRMTEFQAALLMAQMSRLEEQSRRREQNAQYLTSMLREIPGVLPARVYDGCTRNAYHLYMFRYDAARFAGMPRARFLKAMQAEGIPCSGGYSPLNREPFLKNTLASRGYQRVFSKQELAKWEERAQCLENEKLCQEAVWLTQTMLLAERQDMEQIAAAIKKIQAWAPELAKS
jgi:dTDP-4-amino-4,6-dideoxygalactose transaminase